MTLQRLYRLGEELVANANSRDPFQIADEIGLQIQMIKDFTVLKGVYMILHEVPWAFINDNLDDCVRRYETTAGPLKSDTLTAQILHPFRRSYSWGCERGDRLVCQSPRRLA